MPSSGPGPWPGATWDLPKPSPAQEMTLQQLQSLHIAGRQGLRVGSHAAPRLLCRSGQAGGPSAALPCCLRQAGRGAGVLVGPPALAGGRPSSAGEGEMEHPFPLPPLPSPLPQTPPHPPAPPQVPTLEAFLEACRTSGLRRPVLVEVKTLASDQGRDRFLRLLRWAGRVRRRWQGAAAGAGPPDWRRAQGRRLHCCCAAAAWSALQARLGGCQRAAGAHVAHGSVPAVGRPGCQPARLPAPQRPQAARAGGAGGAPAARRALLPQPPRRHRLPDALGRQLRTAGCVRGFSVGQRPGRGTLYRTRACACACAPPWVVD
jgi:hypothetical protein